jgi:hypothetical protein
MHATCVVLCVVFRDSELGLKSGAKVQPMSVLIVYAVLCDDTLNSQIRLLSKQRHSTDTLWPFNVLHTPCTSKYSLVSILLCAVWRGPRPKGTRKGGERKHTAHTNSHKIKIAAKLLQHRLGEPVKSTYQTIRSKVQGPRLSLIDWCCGETLIQGRVAYGNGNNFSLFVFHSLSWWIQRKSLFSNIPILS